LIELARHRDDASVTEIALARHSQPGVLDVNRLHPGFVKSRARRDVATHNRKINAMKKASSARGTARTKQ
jgi:hypothetical protein